MRKVLSTGMTRMVERITAAVEAGVADGSLAPVADARGLAEVVRNVDGGALLAKAHRSVAPPGRVLGPDRGAARRACY